MNIKKILLLITTGSLTSCLSTIFHSSSANALILFNSSSSNVQQADNFWNKSTTFLPEQNDNKIFGFNEVSNITLPRNIGIQESFQNIQNRWDTRWNTTNNTGFSQFIQQGMRISSHMIYWSSTGGPSLKTIQADIYFSGIILGLVGDFRLFTLDNDLFAPNRILTTRNTPTTGLEGVEKIDGNLPVDIVTLLAPNAIRLDWKTYNGVDPLRVYTLESVPEPLTIMGSGLGLGFGFLFKRKSKKMAKKEDSTN
ncbi:PEP-CTERM sorting domain-containing protein [Geminocystis sp.]|uniref:PEP-CTERM sorting domain-containing protein n=1 Tax=Geminocystis sp. TaxID=2664100 RepID=UPI003593AAA9